MSSQIATIIGGKGFVGAALARYLSSRGWACQVAARDMPWPQRGADLGHVFYCAGLTGDYLARAADTVEAHVSLLARVLQSERWESLVYLSSTRLYDGLAAGTLAQETARLPVAPQVPRHLFDLTKLTGESLCHAMGRGRARVARLASVYDSPADPNGFLPALLRRVAQAASGETLAVDSSAQAERDYVHLPDVLRALVDIALRGTQTVYNVASGENVSNARLGEMVERWSGRQLAFHAPQVASGSAVVDIGRLQQDFGWRPARLEDVIGPWLRDMAEAP
ncbi:MAG: NAD-dependent epimerase/dehydratase family protein [Hylemonella sp.]|uniref:NAD-dependent epimerase/dehydratase family protein n=1 Tax=Hylemonella sp. TaxID=2066020 RepID=UPI0022CA6A3B|nr:NAD-dependent epimerase/dehydratase family protein [Hylemonella sp.]MCZ8253923.1 NAD-dependent epimerase/dehydratase family protein [Hylemonella sp.]